MCHLYLSISPLAHAFICFSCLQACGHLLGTTENKGMSSRVSKHAKPSIAYHSCCKFQQKTWLASTMAVLSTHPTPPNVHPVPYANEQGLKIQIPWNSACMYRVTCVILVYKAVLKKRGHILIRDKVNTCWEGGSG